MSTLYKLTVGQQLTVTPTNGGRVSVTCGEDSAESAFLRSARTFGPYLVERTFTVRGPSSVTTADATVAGSFAGLLMVNAGTPAAAAQATANVNPTGDDNSLTITAREYGTGGNAITVTYVDPGANDAALSVAVYDKSIVVSLATGGGGAITSTAAQVKAAIEAHQPAHELVSVAIHTADSGVADDGSGVVTAMASTALSGGAGFGIGIARPGGVCIDTENGLVYRNSGTQAAPVWTALADVA